MKQYKVISFDMFQTLVNVNKRIPAIWKGILKENYTKEKGQLGARAVIRSLSDAYKKSVNPFLDMEGMFTLCAHDVVDQLGQKLNPKEIAYQIMYQHGFAPFYEEVLSVMEQLTKEYTVILSSDASHLMVDPIINRCRFQKTFISDDLKCYKGDGTGKFFETVLSELKVHPDEILHVGDSTADMIGAHAAGIDFCWINRENREWQQKDKPEYILHNLTGILK